MFIVTEYAALNKNSAKSFCVVLFLFFVLFFLFYKNFQIRTPWCNAQGTKPVTIERERKHFSKLLSGESGHV